MLSKFVVDKLNYYVAPTGLKIIDLIFYNHDVPPGLKICNCVISPGLKICNCVIPPGLKKSAVGTS